MKSKSRKIKKTKKNIKNNIAGKAIAAGGYGCIFNPALACKNKTRRSNGISKLLIKKEAEKEFAEIEKIKPIINKIPNYQKYFLISNITLCDPALLNDFDLVNFNKCNNLLPFAINEYNINENLDKVQIINQPYGGRDLDNIILEGKHLSIEKFILLNKNLIELLVNAIVPMNKLNLIHNDIKAGNILFDDINNNLRIIDWGFAAIISKSIPEDTWYRPLQFNLPFSSIIFNKNFNEFYKNKLKNLLKTEISVFDLKNIVIEYFYKFIYRTGHYIYLFKYILNDIFGYIYNITPEKHSANIIKYTFGLSIIIDYLTRILYKYTDFKKNELNFQKYYFQVYSKNLDIWGFLTIYINFLVAIQKNIIIFKTDQTKNYIIQIIRNIIIKYLFSDEYAAKAIDIKELVQDLQKINSILK